MPMRTAILLNLAEAVPRVAEAVPRVAEAVPRAVAAVLPPAVARADGIAAA
ncbi:MAG TPA: hypothetical protein VF838_18805 [Trebonia sp.]